MLNVHLADIKCISFDSLKAKTHAPTHECINIQNTTFIRINPRSATMIAAVTEANEMAPAMDKKRKGFSLSSSEGLNEMIQLRNHAQARSLAPVEPTMFAKPEETVDAELTAAAAKTKLKGASAARRKKSHHAQAQS